MSAESVGVCNGENYEPGLLQEPIGGDPLASPAGLKWCTNSGLSALKRQQLEDIFDFHLELAKDLSLGHQIEREKALEHIGVSGAEALLFFKQISAERAAAAEAQQETGPFC